MNVGKIITAIIVIVLVYFIITWFFADGTRTVLTRLHNATVEQTIMASNLPDNPSSHFTFSICFYVDDWNHAFGSMKTLYTRLDQNKNPCPKVQFDKYENNLIVTLATYPTGPGSNASDAREESVTLENVPLQRWTSFILTVNGRAVDLYLDGKLVKTKILNNVPKASKSNIYLTPSPGFGGSTANFLYINRSLNPREVYDLYKEGCGGQAWFTDLFNRYRIKLAFLKDGNEVNTFMI
jgi:hypothetical protein